MKRLTDFGAANRKKNVSMDDKISPEGIMTVLKLHGMEAAPTLRHAAQISIYGKPFLLSYTSSAHRPGATISS